MSPDGGAEADLRGLAFRLMQALESIAESQKRLADHLTLEPADIVGTPYIAGKLGCSTAWVSQLVKDGEIPAHCIVEGSGNGKLWKFYRERIDRWIKDR